MDDITGKKFSLQDWVTRRAANQMGGTVSRASLNETVQPLSIKKAVNGDYGADEPTVPESDEPVINSASTQSVSTPAASAPAAPQNEPVTSSAPQVSASSSSGASSMSSSSSSSSVSSSSGFSAAELLGKSEGRGAPVQQLQIVRLLSELGERLRQSEKEREVLWKEVETCRKQISELGDRNSKTEKTFQTLEGQVGQKEDFIKSLLDKQAELEAALKAQTSELEQRKVDHEKQENRLAEKITSIETATGSAIVRIEDALAENNKLSKRVEQLSQDKARLVRKLEVMEETLTQTQETLKAKALVLLTDQALAARTPLPQQPAWTGDDTLKVSRTAEDRVSGVAPEAAKSSGLVSNITSSLKSKKEKVADMNNAAFFAALVVLGISGGVLLFKSASNVSVPDLSFGSKANKAVPAQAETDQTSGADEQLEPPSQDALMSDIAKLANQIEPASPADGAADKAGTDKGDAAAQAAKPVAMDEANAADHEDEFDKAIAAEDKALEAFQANKPKAAIAQRLKADRALPAAVKDIETKAFSGDARAQHDLAAVYTAGHSGVKVNYDRAVEWFREAAYQNIANAQYNLGVMYHQGLGVPKDINKAIELYRVAAANDHPEAQYNLAIAYIEGVGTEYNPHIAAAYFQKAAAGGIVEAAYNLGLLYENGLLGESQPDEALFWYSLASDKGNEQAKNALKQIKTQLSMTDADAQHIVARVAQSKQGFVNADGKPALPNPAPVSVDNAEPAASVSGAAGMVDGALDGPDAVTISQIQEHLSRLGLYKGKADGAFSTSTGEAIRSYQKVNGLKEDGLPTETLLVHILAQDSAADAPAAGDE